ncbi:MAG TPA: FkbM family methyltransferase, partial [Verrucomicrobiae bacterium]
VRDQGAWGCLEEVFLGGVYEPFFRHLNNVRGWLDLGCNVGFFSLALWEHLRRQNPSASPPQAVLGDANEHCVAMARRAVENNGLAGRWDCRHVVVGPPGETVSFAQFKYSVHSGIFSPQRGEKTYHYRTTDLADLLGALGEDVDLLKLDIEGAERFVFQLHSHLLGRFRYGLCEWHAPHFDGPALRGWIEHHHLELLEMRSQTAEGYDAAQGDSWDSPVGMALWRNPACPG